jgi:putative transposase
VPTVIFSGFVWHITHRCHHKQFLLKFARDRRRYSHWAFEAKKYVVTCNHAHLLVKDTDQDVISQNIQLIAGRTAQEYNQRKNRQGAFWEHRYHATAIEADEHCIAASCHAGVVSARPCRHYKLRYTD